MYVKVARRSINCCKSVWWCTTGLLADLPRNCLIRFCLTVRSLNWLDRHPVPHSVFKICAGQKKWGRKKKKERFRVTSVEARLSRFGINPLWLTSTVEIKAAICLKRLNNVRHSVKHTPAALYIMHQGPAEGLLRRDNRTYPRERWREGEEEREGKRGGTNREPLREAGLETEGEMRGSAMRIQQESINYSAQLTKGGWRRRRRRRWRPLQRPLRAVHTTPINLCMIQPRERRDSSLRGPRDHHTLPTGVWQEILAHQ